MKNLAIITILFFSFATISKAQTKPKAKSEIPSNSELRTPNSKLPDPDYDLLTYKRAMSYGDYEVAKNSLYHMIALHPENNSLLDSLVTLYFSLGAFPQAVLAGNSYLEKDTSNMNMMEMVALANSQLKKYKEAVDLYEKMFTKSGNIYYAYQLAIHQYFLKRVGECGQMIDIIINDPKSTEQKIAITGENNEQQQVPLKAAALNLRGVIMQELNMKDKAKENFEASLKIMPEFSLAKGNMEALNKKEEEKPKIEEKKVEEKKK